MLDFFLLRIPWILFFPLGKAHYAGILCIFYFYFLMDMSLFGADTSVQTVL